MTEGLFILTTIFVAYVVYTVIGDQRAAAKPKAPSAKPDAQPTAVEQPKPQAAVTTEKTATLKPAEAKTVAPKAVTKTAPPPVATKAAAAPKRAAKPSAAKTTAAKPAAAKKTATAAKSAGLKDPKTGEVVTTYSNYRFTKRWIKDALVAEGLLEKVYTANELNAETEAKIKEAIGKLETMDKYKA